MVIIYVVVMYPYHRSRAITSVGASLSLFSGKIPEVESLEAALPPEGYWHLKTFCYGLVKLLSRKDPTTQAPPMGASVIHLTAGGIPYVISFFVSLIDE